MSDDKFSRFREQYKTFTYEDYHITKDDKYITVSFDFKIDGLCEFHPKTEIELAGLDILNDFFVSHGSKHRVFTRHGGACQLLENRLSRKSGN